MAVVTVTDETNDALGVLLARAQDRGFAITSVEPAAWRAAYRKRRTFTSLR